MSASLVGSEMCIRDRTTTLLRISRGIGRIIGGFSGGSEEFLYRGLMAVSYTHLTLPTICSV
eukprot:349027-Alexandrium_andersonii.AAC.1